MIRLKLERDQARQVTTWFNYWHMICNGNIAHPDNVQNQKYLWKVFDCIIYQVEKKFDTKLNSKAKKLNFTLTPAEGIILQEFCKKTPIDGKEFYLLSLRQFIIDRLDVQII